MGNIYVWATIFGVLGLIFYIWYKVFFIMAEGKTGKEAITNPIKESKEVFKPIVMNLMSLKKQFESYHDYFLSMGMIKTDVPFSNSQIDEDVNKSFIFPLYKKIKNDYYDVFELSSNDYYAYGIYIERHFHKLQKEIKHIYNEITKNENLFYLIFKYNVEYNFKTNLHTAINSEALQIEAVKKLESKNLDYDDKLLLLEFKKIRDIKGEKDDQRLEELKASAKERIYANVEAKKTVEAMNELHESEHAGEPVQTFVDPTVDIIKKYSN